VAVADNRRRQVLLRRGSASIIAAIAVTIFVIENHGNVV